MEGAPFARQCGVLLLAVGEKQVSERVLRRVQYLYKW